MLLTRNKIGCFGKLPGSEEFIRLDVGDQTVVAVERWLEAGMESIRHNFDETWKARYDAAPPQTFILHLGEGARPIAGVLFFSRDRGGRRFPFAIFTAIEGRIAETLAPVALAPLFSYAIAEIKRTQRLAPDAFLASMEKLQMAAPAELKTQNAAFAAYLRKTTNGALWTSLFGGPADPRKYLLLQNLFQILAPFQQKRVQHFSLALQFPLPGSERERPLVSAFWRHLVASLFGERDQKISSFSTAGDRSGLLIFLQPPSPASLRFVLEPGLDDDRLCVLARDGEANPSIFREVTREALESPTLTLSDLVAIFVRQEMTSGNGRSDRTGRRMFQKRT